MWFVYRHLDLLHLSNNFSFFYFQLKSIKSTMYEKKINWKLFYIFQAIKKISRFVFCNSTRSRVRGHLWIYLAYYAPEDEVDTESQEDTSSAQSEVSPCHMTFKSEKCTPCIYFFVCSHLRYTVSLIGPKEVWFVTFIFISSKTGISSWLRELVL